MGPLFPVICINVNPQQWNEQGILELSLTLKLSSSNSMKRNVFCDEFQGGTFQGFDFIIFPIHKVHATI